jgi:hypothetical protein
MGEVWALFEGQHFSASKSFYRDSQPLLLGNTSDRWSEEPDSSQFGGSLRWSNGSSV